MPDVVRLFLMIITWEPDDTVSQRMIEVPMCPSWQSISEEFDPKRKSGEIKSWTAFCLPAKFEFLKGKKI